VTRTTATEVAIELDALTDQWQYYAYDADGHRTRRRINGQETWQLYFEGELLAEYAAGAAATSPQKEYGYRNGQLLVTAEPPSAQQSTENVVWTNAVGVSVSGNSLTKTAADNWGNSGASSQQAIMSGDGYVQFTASEAATWRMAGLSNGDGDQGFSEIDFALYQAAGQVGIYAAGTSRGCFGTYTSGDVLRVGVESGVVKYKRNGTVVYTSTVSDIQFV
jgi:hypothetical protein